MTIRDQKWWSVTLRWWMFAALIGWLLGLLSVTYGAEPPAPHFTPVPHFAPVPKFIDIPVTAEVRKEPVKKAVEKTWGIVGWSRACPSCPLQPTYGWIDEEVEADDEAKAEAAVEKLAQGTLTKEEFAALEKEVPAPVIRKVLEQRWDIASCGMICASHGARLYNVYDDGTVEPAPDQPGEGGGDAGGRMRLFRGRR